MFLSLSDFKKRIEYSLVPHFLNEDEVVKKSKSAINAGVGVMCVNPNYITLVKKLIGNCDIYLSANIGFPWGTHHTEFKVLETKKAISEGANQIDMVINVGALRSNKDDEVLNDIRSVVESAKGCIVKVIIETWVLNEDEKIRVCKLVEKAGANLVKTTTGVRTQYIDEFLRANMVRGAELEDIILFRQILNPNIKIKASGGVYSLEDAFKFIKAGTNQLGVSKGIELIKEFEEKYKNGIEI